MPIVRIDIEAGKPVEYRQAVMRGVRRAITGALGVPDERVSQRVVETPAADIDAGAGKSDRYTVIEVSMLPGRDAELKGAMYSAIAQELLADPGITYDDLVVLVRDPAAECFFLNGAMCDAPAGAVRASTTKEAS